MNDDTQPNLRRRLLAATGILGFSLILIYPAAFVLFLVVFVQTAVRLVFNKEIAQLKPFSRLLTSYLIQCIAYVQGLDKSLPYPFAELQGLSEKDIEELLQRLKEKLPASGQSEQKVSTSQSSSSPIAAEDSLQKPPVKTESKRSGSSGAQSRRRTSKAGAKDTTGRGNKDNQS